MSAVVNHIHNSKRSSHRNKANFREFLRHKRASEAAYVNPALFARLSRPLAGAPVEMEPVEVVENPMEDIYKED